ncbi:unnamed protein product [Adineta ricciae]|uniref:R3H domain-containing protein n=1 Tax=Adineta ricciae TaxID=249248 RepID=A0A814FWB4_ADIRI|nr:unnamed protein product [Adineta ricciae]
MGILKNFEGDIHDNENVNSVAQIDSLLQPHHFDGSSSSSSEDEEVQENPIAPATVAAAVPVTRTRTPKVKKPVSKMPKPILHVKNIGGKKSQGNRQSRRHENMCFLLNLARDLDEDFAEISINDLVETTISAFAQLLLNKNKMKVWHEFIELPERQQEHIVKLATDKKSKKKKSKLDTTSNSCSSDDTLESFVLVENRTTTNDNQCERLAHLQEEATTCYRRIDPNIRSTFKSMLKRHHLPFDRISWFEDDVIPFFKENADSVYLRDLNNSFDRMLLHAVCQYLNLISKSFTRDGERYTQVENRRIEFVPPIILLSEYVKTMQMNPTGLVNDILSNHVNKTVS